MYRCSEAGRAGLPGWDRGMADRMKRKYSTLDKELRASGTFKLGLEDAVEIMTHSHDAKCPPALDLLNMMADLVGAEVVLLPDASDDKTCTATHVANLMRECSDVVASASESVADNDLSPNEFARIEKQWAEMLHAGQGLMRYLRAKLQADQARWSNGGGAK